MLNISLLNYIFMTKNPRLIPSASPKSLNFEARAPLKKIGFSGQIFIKLTLR